jgi:hypothetical protein
MWEVGKRMVEGEWLGKRCGKEKGMGERGKWRKRLRNGFMWRVFERRTIEGHSECDDSGLYY